MASHHPLLVTLSGLFLLEEELVVVPGGQHSPAGGAPGVQLDALQKAVGAEDVSTHSGENLVAWVRIFSRDGQR